MVVQWDNDIVDDGSTGSSVTRPHGVVGDGYRDRRRGIGVGMDVHAELDVVYPKTRAIRAALQ